MRQTISAAGHGNPTMIDGGIFWLGAMTCSTQAKRPTTRASHDACLLTNCAVTIGPDLA